MASEIKSAVTEERYSKEAEVPASTEAGKAAEAGARLLRLARGC